jgi:hypothetical protein
MSSNANSDTKKTEPIVTIAPIQLAAKADNAAKAMADKAQNDFIKNLFQKVQGVKYDDRCPHPQA